VEVKKYEGMECEMGSKENDGKVRRRKNNIKMNL
jgi:hypothetical protein